MIERTHDYRRVKRIADANPREDDVPWKLIVSSDYIYLMEVQEGRDVGVWCLEPHPHRAMFYYIHVAMTPECRGKDAVRSGLDALAWAFANTDCKVIYGHTPIKLRHAQVIPRKAGMKYVGNKDGCKVYRMTIDQFLKSKEAA